MTWSLFGINSNQYLWAYYGLINLYLNFNFTSVNEKNQKMKKVFFSIVLGISVNSYCQKTFKLCSVEEGKLDTIAQFFKVSKEEALMKGKLVIGPTNFTIYVGQKIVYNQKVINFEITYSNPPFVQYTHKKNDNIWIRIMEETPVSQARVTTSLDGIKTYTYKVCK